MIRRKIIFVFAAVIANAYLLNAQNLLINGSFEGPFGVGSTSSGCPFFFNLTGCYATHGTPMIGTSGAAHLSNFANMWYQNTWGEGVALSMNTTTIDRHEYRLCFWYRTTNDPGTVNFLLATSPSSSNFIGCGDPIPTFSPAQVLTPVTPLPAAATWTYYTTTFICNSSSYNTLVFYPQNNSSSVFSLDIDGVVLNVSDCPSSVIMDMSNYPNPSGEYRYWNYILAGSHTLGSSTTAAVTASPTVNTTFRAGHFVTLDDNFVADPNNGHFFLAQLGPCIEACEDNGQRIAAAQAAEQNDLSGSPPEVFPNPFTSSLNIRHLREGQLLEIFDAEGRLVWKTTASAEQISCDPGVTTKGILLLKITDVSGSYSVLRIVRE